MDGRSRRSTHVTTTATAPSAPSSSGVAPVHGRRLQVDFEALYRTSRDDVFAYVATLLRDHSAAEDVTATAFERAFRKQRSYRPDRGTARAWLFGIARNAALDELRRRKRTAELPADPPAPPDDPAERAVLRAAVAAALTALPPRDREIVALKYHAGLDNAELAAVLGVSPSNAGTLLHRAMTKLREAVDVT
jgi:RNA polymerase sigma factor (sigma-70 family)